MFLITLPDYEIATRYASKWAELTIKFTTLKVIKLSQKKANKKTVSSFLKKQPVKLVMFNGHGDESTIYGNDDEVLIKSGLNEDLLNSKIVYAVACSCAAILGPSSVKKGCKAFIGYKRPFMFAGWGNAHNPILDDRAKPFFESSNLIVTSLMKGCTVEESCNKSKQLIQNSISQLLSSQATNDDRMDASMLFWNSTNLTYSGNGKSDIYH